VSRGSTWCAARSTRWRGLSTSRGTTIEPRQRAPEGGHPLRAARRPQHDTITTVDPARLELTSDAEGDAAAGPRTSLEPQARRRENAVCSPSGRPPREGRGGWIGPWRRHSFSRPITSSRRA
jgi:hypothetical protein